MTRESRVALARALLAKAYEDTCERWGREWGCSADEAWQRWEAQYYARSPEQADMAQGETLAMGQREQLGDVA